MSTVAYTNFVEPRILERLNCPLQDIAELCKMYQVNELSIFGSAVRDDFDAIKSDIDFLVDFNPDARLHIGQYVDLEEKLAELVGRNVDLVSKTSMRPHWHNEIVPTAKVIYAA